MITGTTYVLPDEPALNLAEVNLIAPKEDGTDWYRFQIILLWRDGLVEYRERLGLAKNFKAHQFRIMGGSLEEKELFIDETVGSLKDMADQMRNETPMSLQELRDRVTGTFN